MKKKQCNQRKVLLLALIFGTGNYLSGQSFTQIFPYLIPPKINSVFALSSETAVAGGSGSTIIKTTNAGISWFKISGVSGNNTINDILFIDSFKGYAAADGSTIYITIDGGNTWSAKLVPVSNQRLIKIASAGSQTIFVSTASGGVYRSFNGGNSWELAEIPVDNSLESISFYNETHGIIVTGAGETYTTSDGGDSWFLKPIGRYIKLRDVVLTDQNKIIAIGDSGTIALSFNFGNDWVFSNFQQNTNLLKLHISDWGYMFIIDEAGTVYRSADEGITWSLVATPSQMKIASIHTGPSGSIYLGGLLGQLAVKNSLNDWNFYEYLRPGDIHAVSCSSYDNAYVAADSGFIYFLSYVYTSYSVITPTRENLYAIQAKGDSAVWAVGSNGAVIRKHPTAHTYSAQHSGVTTDLRSIYVINKNSAISVGDSGTVIRTTDGGLTWLRGNSTTTKHLTSVKFFNDTVGIAVGENGVILRSSNLGADWIQVPSPVTTKLRSITLRNYPYCAAAGDSGIILWSSDAGMTWTVSQANSLMKFISITFVNAFYIYAVVEGVGVYRIDVNTANMYPLYINDWYASITDISVWSTASMAMCGTRGLLLSARNNPNIPVELLTFSAKNIDGKILLTWNTATETNNRGFEVQKSINNTDWFDISFVTGSGTATEPAVYTFTDNYPSRGIMYYRLRQIDYDGRAEILRQIEVPFESSYELEQNYPNPFNPATEISYSIPYAGKVSIIVYDALGREVQVLVNKLQEPGRYTVSFNGSSLASGIYYYTISAGGFFETKKMILIK